MSSRKASKKCILSYILLFVIIAFGICLIFIHKSIKQHLAELCRYKCGEIVNNILCDVSLDAAASANDYYRIRRDASGQIISISADTKGLNDLQSSLRKAVNTGLSTSEYDVVTLTLGDLTDIPLFSGRGPDINIRYQQSGTVDTEISSSFESAGINQTRLRVSVIVSVEFTAFLPTGEEKLVISEEYIAADDLIVGKVPDYYIRDPSITEKAAA